MIQINDVTNLLNIICLALQAKLLCWISCRLRSASFKPSEWIEFKFKMAKLTQADKVIIQTLREQGFGAKQDSVPPIHASRQAYEWLKLNIPDFITEDATAT